MDNKVKFQQYANMLRAWSAKMNATFLPIDSMHVTCQPKIAKTTPGKPAPLPKSMICASGGKTSANCAESAK